MAPKYTPRVHEFLRAVLVPAVTDDVFGGSDSPVLMLAELLPAVDTVLARCESPIEQLVAAAFIARGWFNEDLVTRGALVSGPVIGGRTWLRGISDELETLLLRQQVVIDDPIAARLDFAVQGRGKPWMIAIECDGHDFHERTKEQAERDRSRDRALTTAGWRVLRFTGREIWRDPLKVVDEVVALAVQLSRGA